jgi:hypothetical protein
LRDDASLEELRVEVLKHFEQLAPVLDFKALAALSDGGANREVPQGFEPPGHSPQTER